MKLTEEMKNQALEAFIQLMESGADINALVILSGTEKDPAGFGVTIGSSRNLEKALIGRMLLEPDLKEILFAAVDSYRETDLKLKEMSPEISKTREILAKLNSDINSGKSLEEALGEMSLEEYDEMLKKATKEAKELSESMAIDNLLKDSGINLN